MNQLGKQIIKLKLSGVFLIEVIDHHDQLKKRRVDSYKLVMSYLYMWKESEGEGKGTFSHNDAFILCDIREHSRFYYVWDCSDFSHFEINEYFCRNVCPKYCTGHTLLDTICYLSKHQI